MWASLRTRHLHAVAREPPFGRVNPPTRQPARTCRLAGPHGGFPLRYYRRLTIPTIPTLSHTHQGRVGTLPAREGGRVFDFTILCGFVVDNDGHVEVLVRMVKLQRPGVAVLVQDIVER